MEYTKDQIGLRAIRRQRRRLSIRASSSQGDTGRLIPIDDVDLGDWHAVPATLVARKNELETLYYLKRYLLGELERHREEIIDHGGRASCISAPTRPRIDPGHAIIDRILQVEDRITKMIGLDAPRRREAEVVTEETVEREIKRLDAAFLALDEPD